MKQATLTLGPVLFNWTPENWREFYKRIADEAPIDTVYLGEIVCSKRAPFFEPLYTEVAEILQKAGKQVVFSTLAEVMLPRERAMVESLCKTDGLIIEANDATALYHLQGRPHRIGPFFNLFNEAALAVLAKRGATHATLPYELPHDAMPSLAAKAKALNVGLEVQVYGRIPLALSARCYHARAHGRIKDNCRFVCGEDADGMNLRTRDGTPFLAINGIQTLSHGCLNLMAEMNTLAATGVHAFRLSPHSHDMVQVAKLFRAVLDGTTEPQAATKRLAKLAPDMPFIDGFLYHQPGCSWSHNQNAA